MAPVLPTSRRPHLLAAVLLVAACGSPAPPVDEAPEQPITVLAVAPQPFRPALTAFGVVRAAAVAELVAPFPGQVSYPPRFAAGLHTGTRVSAGETVAWLVDSEDGRALTEARLMAKEARAEYERFRKAWDAGVAPESTMDRYRAEAELAAARLEGAEGRVQSRRLVTPVSGVLAEVRELPPHSYVGAGTVLAKVLASEGGRVEAWVAAGDRASVHEGQSATIRGPRSGGTARGTVRDVAPAVEGGAVRIVIEVADAAALPPPGEGAEVSLELALRPTALLVPIEAVVIDGDQSSVFVTVRQDAGLLARRRAVVLGARRDGWTEVIEGLREGERVAVDGVAFLADGDRVSEVRDQRLPTPPRWEPVVEDESVRP